MATKGQSKPVKAQAKAKPGAKKEAAPKQPGGRPSKYDAKVAAEICTRLAKGEPLAEICRNEHMPAVRTVSDWKAAHTDFSADFARAREEGFDYLAADCLRIADDGINDTYVDENGNARTDTDVIQRSKLRIETRLKLLAKWDPKRYGDRVMQEVSGPDGGAQQHEHKVTLSAEEAYRRLIDGK